MGSGSSSNNKTRKKVTFADGDEADYPHPHYYRDQTEDDSGETQRQASTLSLGHKILVIARQRKAVDDWYQRAHGTQHEKSHEDVREEFENDVTWKERLRQRVLKQQEREDRLRALQPVPQQPVILYTPGGEKENSRSDTPTIDLANYMEFQHHNDENSNSYLQNYSQHFRDYTKDHTVPPTPNQNSGSNKGSISVSEASGNSLPQQLSLTTEGDSKTLLQAPPLNQTRTPDSIGIRRNNNPQNNPRTINKPRVPTPVETDIQNEAKPFLDVPHKERYLNEEIKPKEEEFNIPHKEYYLNENFEYESPVLQVPHNEKYVNESMLTAKNGDGNKKGLSEEEVIASSIKDDKQDETRYSASDVIQNSDIDEYDENKKSQESLNGNEVNKHISRQSHDKVSSQEDLSITVNNDTELRGIQHEGYINENYDETAYDKNSGDFFNSQKDISTMASHERIKKKRTQQITFTGGDSGLTKHKKGGGYSNTKHKKTSQLKPKDLSVKQSVYHEAVPKIMREKAELEFKKKENVDEKPKTQKVQPISKKYRNYRHSYKTK